MSAIYSHMRNEMDAFSSLSDETWQRFLSFCRVITKSKGEHLYPYSHMPTSYCFLHKGVARLYACDELGQEYNKRFFIEGQFPGVMSALHLGKATDQGIECLTDCELVEVDFHRYRTYLFTSNELMAFQIKYLEANWLLDKDQREILLVQQDATARYLLFLKQWPTLTNRIAQYHVASHLGISATQLSRIRKSLNFVEN
ncbi:Crp/Fnr family transcriptional regulator [Pseudoalteromonas sp. MMG013]|uniref:Crp/Fnr family transcriptional regulator n=1 Tax=Pseudoalteromonas sp. MMG013 TaxID=2822687 RepID=UPI001B35DA9B|nr:Crp/Fnr family transcriptional regulator [Pseudoalteromonas sp. MMG013]MBQ4860222.1 Crp/Fnr family transcriptional regulator [Pseudoalteromonas sp. MMG013]